MFRLQPHARSHVMVPPRLLWSPHASPYMDMLLVTALQFTLSIPGYISTLVQT